MKLQLGYCTNVHAGTDLAQTRANLECHACAVKQRFSPDRPMGLGLWLPASAVRQMLAENRVEEWRDWLADQELVPFTLNGFPYGDFHQRVVKHDVYRPTWWQVDRLNYTFDLIEILHGILPPGLEGSISTLPIAWPTPRPSSSEWEGAANQLRQVAERLQALEETTGRLIYLCLEPEPGCLLQLSSDLVNFFERWLLQGKNADRVRRYLRVCHDICHQAIMFERQADVFRRYHDAGIHVGKVQVSSAVRWQQLAAGVDEEAGRQQLAGFVEERYLHQTMIQYTPDMAPVFFEDLPIALEQAPRQKISGEWRVHFHMPIYLERFGQLETTQFAIHDCLEAAREWSTCTHFEAETYAWGVLPRELQQPDLAAGIAEEMKWLEKAIRK